MWVKYTISQIIKVIELDKMLLLLKIINAKVIKVINVDISMVSINFISTLFFFAAMITIAQPQIQKIKKINPKKNVLWIIANG